MTRKQKALLILLLGALAAISPLSIDMYLPGFKAIALSLKTDVAQVGLTLSSYFLGISFGQLAYGPLIERFGRKKPLLIGLGIYAVSSIGCALAFNIESLILARFLMAIGGCVGMVASRAVVRDLFPVSETARIFSFLLLVMGIAPIIGPTIGGIVVATAGWRTIFVILTVFSLLLIGTYALFFQESKPADPSVSLKPLAVLKGYGEVLKQPQFVVFSLAAGVTSGGMFAYISGAPFLFMEEFGLTEQQFGWMFGLNAFGLIGGSQLNRLWLTKSNSAAISLQMNSLQVVLSVILLIGSMLGILNIYASFGLIFLYMTCLGFMNPNNTALALAPFTKGIGNASALTGFTQMAIGAAASALISHFHNDTSLPMMIAMLTCGALSLIAMVYFRLTNEAIA